MIYSIRPPLFPVDCKAARFKIISALLTVPCITNLPVFTLGNPAAFLKLATELGLIGAQDLPSATASSRKTR